MKILILGPDKEPQRKLVELLLNDGNSIAIHEERLNYNYVSESKYDYLISFGYRYLIKENVLNFFKGKAINLHISLLPWNKGADPNLWSLLESTPKGVTIHQIDSGLDTGKIFCQKEIYFGENETLKSTYNLLNDVMIELFKVNWIKIKNEKLKPKAQIGAGTYHKSSDKRNYMHLLTNGWDTSIKDIEGRAINV